MPHYREQTATGPLSVWVECAWFLECGDAVRNHRVPPDGCVDIVYDRENGLRAIGAMTVEQRFDYPQDSSMAGVRLRPGKSGSFLGVPAAEFTDSSVALADLWPRRAREWQKRLDDARSIRDTMRLMLRSLTVPQPALSPVQQAIDALAAANGNADLDRLAEEASLSPRQFRRRCMEASGLGPKHLARILRFRHACSIARNAARRDWASLAVDAGYYDQSHFIRDFREFTGQSPMAVLSNTATGGPA